MSLVASWCEGKLVMKQLQEMVEFQMVVLRVIRTMDFWIIIDGWKNRWVKSDWKKDENMAGEWNFTSSKWDGEANDKGIQTSKDYRFYAISAAFLSSVTKERYWFSYSMLNTSKSLVVVVDT
ncbi:calreticulin-like [Papaver somniferum]|uniref:calreticulin-like n=1 Tax=Papaver somniferum TaxID=3469 RepID=UPI000E702711|nr:calreticulin-like [Papaver somniferum]